MVELVAVMVLLSILAVYAVPRFTGTSNYDEFAVQNALLSVARMAQQRATYDHRPGWCYRLNLEADRFGVQRSQNGDAGPWAYLTRPFDPTNDGDPIIGAYRRLNVTAGQVYFDDLGNATVNCAGALNGASQNFNITGVQTLTIRICPTGYATLQNC